MCNKKPLPPPKDVKKEKKISKCKLMNKKIGHTNTNYREQEPLIHRNFNV
jgi:hypothetical protein